MNILVTGGAGYIGSHAVRCLLRRGHRVWVYDNLCFGHRAAVPDGLLIEADLEDSDRLDHALMIHGIDAVMHFAAFAFVGESVTDPAKYYRNNTVNTLNLMDRLRKHGIGRFVFSSTCATYGNPARVPIDEDCPQAPINPYGQSKLVIEKALADYARAYGWGYAALRYFNAAGAAADGSIGEDHKPETHLIPLILQTALGQRPRIDIFGTDYATPDGSCIRDYIHVDDLAEAHALALEKLGAGTQFQLNLGIGQGYSVRQVIAAAEQVTGHKIPVAIGPRRAGDPPELVAAPGKAMKELGWRPKYIDIESILETAWNWHRTHPHGFDH